jgi:hypothetical protein
MVTGLLSAQDTVRTLLITEFRGDDSRANYVEISNVGNTTLNLADFQIGTVSPWSPPIERGNLVKAWTLIASSPWPFTIVKRLPEQDLAPGESFFIGAVYDWNPKAYAKGDPKARMIGEKKEVLMLADIQAHFPEDSKAAGKQTPMDSVNIWHRLLDQWSGAYGIYLAQYLSPTDSVVIDLVNAYEWDADGTRDESPRAVAGVTDATSATTLFRRFSVKKGNLDFLSAAGVDYEDSEWIPVPKQLSGWEMWRSLYWTVGNHGDYNLDESTLVSNTVDINWADSILTVPWGVRRDDSLMFQFDHKPGLAWHFDYAPTTNEDSSYFSLKTGDVFTMYAIGNDVDIIKWKIVVSPPTAGENRVVPKKFPNASGFYNRDPAPWDVTDKVPGMDTIRMIPFAIRTDTLLKYLEKATEATWEFEYVDGKARTDLQLGDILKVTAKNGAVKKYYIKPSKYVPSHDANLASITWPDIPEFYKGLYGWTGDTIPNFGTSITDYVLPVPLDVPGIPALVAKTRSINAKLDVDRAKNLAGSNADKTVTFTVTAQDDTTIMKYAVQMEKEKDLSNVQPWIGEPFISQFVWMNIFANAYLEVVNPGTEPLDLSNYMIVSGYAGNPADAITQAGGAGDFGERYRKYIPGYKWVNETQWAITPAIAEPDININPIVLAGDVFLLGQVYNDLSLTNGGAPPDPYSVSQLDINLGDNNPWGETLAQWSSLQMWFGKIYFFKILNDSVKTGLKKATDPNDFELLDCFADNAGQWIVGGIPTGQTFGFTRKPEINHGNPVIGGSFGTDEENSEWIMVNEARLQAKNYPWPDWRAKTSEGVGSHFMKAYTGYMSTVFSSVYKVTPGFSLEEQIRGVVTGTTVEQLLAKLSKADEGQSLYVISGTDTLTATDVVADGDILSAVSFDEQNTTNYALEVTAEGLPSDAVLTSTEYTIEISGATGTIKGFDYGVTLRTVVENVVVPDGASFNVINGADAYVPLMLLNYDTLLVDVYVNADIYFEVIAENGTTKIVYQLVPNTMNSGAFVTSNVYDVNQETSLIDLVPNGCSVYGLIKALVLAPGATMKVVDKLGFERSTGNIYRDDRIVVTSEDGATTKTYYLKYLSVETSYLAYVLSDVYVVDQVEFTIQGWDINVNMTISTFLSMLVASENATMMVTNAAGDEQSGNLDVGDLLVVTAGDGVTKNTYAITVGLATENLNSRSINVYPNPSSGMIYVSGLEAGNRVSVNNMMGQRMIDRVVQQNTEVIDLKGQAAGIYFVTVNKGDKVVGRYKLVLQ